MRQEIKMIEKLGTGVAVRVLGKLVQPGVPLSQHNIFLVQQINAIFMHTKARYLNYSQLRIGKNPEVCEAICTTMLYLLDRYGLDFIFYYFKIILS